jgi:hypothetical protein
MDTAVEGSVFPASPGLMLLPHPATMDAKKNATPFR